MPKCATALKFAPIAAAIGAFLIFENASAAAVDDGVRVAIAGTPAVTTPATPSQYNKIWVKKFGPQDAGHVLILLPGSPAGQSDFDIVARALVARVPNLAVWSFDRRENALEDTRGFRVNDPGIALCYYLIPGCGFDPVQDADAKFVAGWGATVTLNDIRRAVLAARDGGKRKVILGGHSAGAVTTPTYAAWDFDGKPGYADLEGMVLIDGGQMGAFDSFLTGTPFAQKWTTVARAKAALAHLAAGTEPFPSIFGFAGPSLGKIPMWPIGVLPELGCQYALDDPKGTSMLQLGFNLIRPLLPKDLADIIPAFPITNEAFMGVVFNSNNDELAALHVRVGRLAAERPFGPRGWLNGPYGTVPSVCALYVQEPGNAMAWYYPIRLDMDLLLALDSLKRTPVTDYLGLRPYHLADIDLPLYVFETDISKGGVLKAANKFIAQTKIPRHTFVSDPSMGHFDPLGDVATNNKFIASVVPFLKGITKN